VLPATGVSQLLTKEDVSSVKKMKKVKTVWTTNGHVDEEAAPVPDDAFELKAPQNDLRI
jgi:hypothetical protein